MANKNNEWFGIVRWCDEDIESALEDQGFEPTEENVAKLHNLVDNHWFEDMMIEAGWNYIYEQIADHEEELTKEEE